MVNPEQRALLTRAAQPETARQKAVATVDVEGQVKAEHELQQSWRRYGQLERERAEREL